MNHSLSVEYEDSLDNLLRDQNFVLYLEGICKIIYILLQWIFAFLHKNFLQVIEVSFTVVFEEVFFVFYASDYLNLLLQLSLVRLPHIFLSFFLSPQSFAAKSNPLNLIILIA